MFLTLLSAPGPSARPDPFDHVLLHLSAETPVFEPIPEGGAAVPRIRGFGFNQRPGEPMLPLRIHLVAIPEEVTPTLVIRSATPGPPIDRAVPPVPHVRPRDRAGQGRDVTPVRPSRAGDLSDESDEPPAREYLPSRAIYEGGEFPAAPARLGSIGYLRDQRYVEVIHTPVLYDPKARRIRHFASVDLEVRLDGAAAREPGRPFRPDPHFESIYASSLINYEQGKAWRVTGEDASIEGPAASASSFTAAAGTAPRYKIRVSASGIYRLDHAYLSAHAAELLAFDPRTWILSAEGVDVPIVIRSLIGGAGESDGIFGPDDALEFYGREKTEPPTLLNHDFPGTFPDVFQANDFTDTQIYWLTSMEPAGAHPRIPDRSGSPVSGFAQPSHFEETAAWDEDDVYFPLGDADPFFSLPDLLAGSANSQRTISLALPGLASASGDATIGVRLRGGTSLAANPDHRTIVTVNNRSSSAADFTWDGEVMQDRTFTVPHSILSNPASVRVELPGLAGVSVDRQYLDSISIRYRRTFAAASDRLVFNHPNQDARFAVTGFSGPPAAIFDISRTRAGSAEADPVRITGASLSGAPTTTYTFEAARDPDGSAPALRRFAVAGPQGLRTPAGMTRAPDPVLLDPALEADLIVIAARDAVDATPGGALDALLQHRLATQGLTSKVVYMDQVTDEFGFGLPGPNALRAFLSYAYDNWRGPGGGASPVSFVLLVGDATPDYKNTLGRADWIDQVPTPMMFQRNSILGYYSSDNWTASFRGGDQMPDVILGRISTRTPATSAAVFSKILRYETSPPAGTWKGRIVLTTGEGKVSGESDSYEALQDDLVSRYFTDAPFTTPDPPLYFAQPPWNASDAAGFKTALIGALDGGTSFLSYIGHGAFNVWGLTTFFTNADADALTNDGPIPFMVNVNCLSGGFHFIPQAHSLAEAMTNNPAGGAIASLAPAGLSALFIGEVVSDGLYEPIFGIRRERVLGAAAQSLRTDLWSRGSIVDLQSFAFLGDPATVLAIPAPAPPSSLQAAPGSGEVDLSWTPPPEPVAGVRVYRSAGSSGGPYAPIPCDPSGPSSCVDRSAVNATTYYYYAVSFDTEGFEGGASNFNTDCDGGPDCVTATPINPDPPSIPAGLAVTDPGTGWTLEVRWSPNPETDIDFYTLHIGTAPMSSIWSLAFDASTLSTVVRGLSEGTDYYFALSATNTSGLESGLSAEVRGTPRLVLGVAPPRAIDDLAIAAAGNDLVLAWSRPLEDIFGRPTEVVRYEIHRDPSPSFVPSPANVVGTLQDGALTSFVDPGMAGSPGPLHYLVRAYDAAGLASGAGRDLPNGVSDLRVTHLGGNLVRLTWSPVTTDVRGLPTLIDHYEVHGRASPIPRFAIGPGTLLVDSGPSLSVDLTVTDSLFYFSVIAVDNRGNVSPY